VFTFLTIIHVIVCIFLMLVVLLQAGRGGGIGLAFGGSGGSQSVFGSSGGANFLTKLTAVCAFIFFTNSLALAYLSSQSDSRRLKRLDEKNAIAKKAEESISSKMMKDIDKQREEQANAAAQKSEATPSEQDEKVAAEKVAPAEAPQAAPAKLAIPAKNKQPEKKVSAELKTDSPIAAKKALPVEKKAPALGKKASTAAPKATEGESAGDEPGLDAPKKAASRPAPVKAQPDEEPATTP
jgi:preprotein translocase subunit SecG